MRSFHFNKAVNTRLTGRSAASTQPRSSYHTAESATFQTDEKTNICANCFRFDRGCENVSLKAVINVYHQTINIRLGNIKEDYDYTQLTALARLYFSTTI